MSNTTDPTIRDDLAGIIAESLPWEKLAGNTVLVTGANGMLPSYVVMTLLALNDAKAAGIKVIGLARNGEKARRILAPILDRDDFELMIQDVTAPIDVPGPVDLVIHGASAARPSLHAKDPVGTVKANLQGTFRLLDLCVAKGAHFVLMSSAEVYGNQAPEVGLIEENSYGAFDILQPRACYSEGKRASETIAAVYHAQHDIPCTIGRFGHIYGPGMAMDDGRVQADFAAHVVRGDDIVLNSDGRASRTYTYVADAIAGLFYAVLLGDELAYNIADEQGAISIRQLAEEFTKVRPDKRLELKFANPADQASFGAAKAQELSSARLRGLGWEPRHRLAQGLDKMVTSLEYAAS